MKLIVLEDDPLFRKSIEIFLAGEHSVVAASSVPEASAILDKTEVDAAIIDLNLGKGLSGMDFLALFKKRFPDKPALVQSFAKDIPTVIQCIKLGAEDYIEKPFDADTLRLKLSKVFSSARRNRVLTRELEKMTPEIIGNDPQLLKAKAQVARAGKMRILFTGETGVGKTPFARYSNRIVSEGDGELRPFEQVNCAALSRDQFQDVLFGHKKGAFTGAVTDKKGLVEIAENGDLFLDEIGEMPMDVQANFLTFLDSMEYYRLGDDKKRRANVRILCATNRDLRQMVDKGLFRRDLYSRVSQVVVLIPPLRDRRDDIELLFEHFVKKFAGFAKPYDPAVLPLLRGFRWEEGNVRELSGLVEYLCQMGRASDRLEIAHMADSYRPVDAEASCDEVKALIGSQNHEALYEIGLESYLDQLESELLKKCLDESTEGLDILAERLKTSKATLYRRLKKYSLSLVEETDRSLGIRHGADPSRGERVSGQREPFQLS